MLESIIRRASTTLRFPIPGTWLALAWAAPWWSAVKPCPPSVKRENLKWSLVNGRSFRFLHDRLIISTSHFFLANLELGVNWLQSKAEAYRSRFWCYHHGSNQYHCDHCVRIINDRHYICLTICACIVDFCVGMNVIKFVCAHARAHLYT